MRLVETEPLAAPLDHGVRKRRRRASQFAQGGLIAEVEAVPPERVKESGTKPIGASTENLVMATVAAVWMVGRATSNVAAPSRRIRISLSSRSKGVESAPFTDLPEVATPGSWTIARHLISAADVTNRSIRVLTVRLEG